MPEYLSPGVYIEETSFRGKPIEGVSTSTAGFVGTALKGPSGVATLVTSFTEFVRTFGPAISRPSGLGDFLGHAVQGFFNNGGKRAYIVRVLGAGAAAADSRDPAIATGVVLRLTGAVRGPTAALPLNSLRLVEKGATLQIFTRPNKNSAFTLLQSGQVQAYDPARSTVTLTAATAIPAGTTLDPNNTSIKIAGKLPTPGAGSTTNPTFRAVDKGASGNGLWVQIVPQDLPPVRLRTSSFVRSTVQLADFSAASNGPGPAAFTSIDLPAAGMRRVRSGDKIELLSRAAAAATVTVGAITDATVHLKPGAGGHGTSLATDVVKLSVRGAALAAPVSLGQQGNANDYTGLAAGGADFPVAHAVAAMLQPGDTVTIGTNELVVGAVTLATKIAVPSTTGDYRAGQVNLKAAPGRLFVTSTEGLTVPASATEEKLAVGSGANVETASVLLVDRQTNVVFLDTAAAGATFPSFTVTDENWQSAENLVAVAAGSDMVPVSTTASLYQGAVVLVDDGVNPPAERLVKNVFVEQKTIQVDSAITAGVTLSAQVADRAAYVRVQEIAVQVLDGATLVETFPNLSWNPDATATSFRKFYLNVVNDSNAGSALVRILPPSGAPVTPSLVNQPTTPDGFPVKLAGGDDGAPPINTEIIGEDNGPGQRSGIQSLKEREDIALVACPGITDEAVQAALINHCELLKYRFAVLDGKPGQHDVSAIQAHRNNYDTKYAAYYEPWLETLDLSTGNTLTVPPSGHVLGIYARSDTNRGVHKAPANEVVSSITGLEAQFTTGEQEVLNPVGVNLIREFTGRGIRVWGARTISSDQEWKYVNVRRLFIFLEHSIDNGTQWVVFEPNNESLWARVVETITAFLTGVWKTGALMGTKPEDAFFVRCDRSTMTQDDIDNGRLVCLIGVAPTFPAEFVIFRIGQFTATAKS